MIDRWGQGAQPLSDTVLDNRLEPVRFGPVEPCGCIAMESSISVVDCTLYRVLCVVFVRDMVLCVSCGWWSDVAFFFRRTCHGHGIGSVSRLQQHCSWSVLVCSGLFCMQRGREIGRGRGREEKEGWRACWSLEYMRYGTSGSS